MNYNIKSKRAISYTVATSNVGQCATAGKNGMINTLHLPGVYVTWFIGTDVWKHDGSQLFIKGIQPNILIEEDEESIKKNIDKALLKAIEVLNKQ